MGTNFVAVNITTMSCSIYHNICTPTRLYHIECISFLFPPT